MIGYEEEHAWWDDIEHDYLEWADQKDVFDTSLGNVWKHKITPWKVTFYVWNYPAEGKIKDAFFLTLSDIAYLKLRGEIT